MGKLYAAARALAVVAAIAAAFVTIPFIAVILLALGAISAIGNSSEDNIRVFLVALVLTLCSNLLTPVPAVGAALVTIFTGIGTAAFGASVVGVLLGLYRRILGDWNGTKPA